MPRTMPGAQGQGRVRQRIWARYPSFRLKLEHVDAWRRERGEHMTTMDPFLTGKASINGRTREVASIRERQLQHAYAGGLIIACQTINEINDLADRLMGAQHARFSIAPDNN